MTTPVFISYAAADQKAANAICTALELRGLACWIAWRDVTPGANFGDVIPPAIRASRVMVLVFSDHANNSNEIKKEVVLAGRCGVPVIPMRIEDVQPTDAFEYELMTRQWIDLFTGWDEAMARLVRQVEQIAGPSTPPPISPQPPPRPEPSSARNRRTAGLMLATLAAGLAIGGTVLWQINKPPKPPPSSSTSDDDVRRLADIAFSNKQYEQAAILYRHAAEAGNAAAESRLGLLYDDGDGVAQNYTQALDFFKKAADQGYPKAEFNIGVLYNNGRGVAQDYQQAMFWYKKAADQGLPNAQYAIGVLYRDGSGVAQDHQQATYWFKKAADQGYTNGQ